jgi:hypothetical protein
MRSLGRFGAVPVALVASILTFIAGVAIVPFVTSTVAILIVGISARGGLRGALCVGLSWDLTREVLRIGRPGGLTPL